MEINIIDCAASCLRIRGPPQFRQEKLYALQESWWLMSARLPMKAELPLQRTHTYIWCERQSTLEFCELESVWPACKDSAVWQKKKHSKGKSPLLVHEIRVIHVRGVMKASLRLYTELFFRGHIGKWGRRFHHTSGFVKINFSQCLEDFRHSYKPSMFMVWLM